MENLSMIITVIGTGMGIIIAMGAIVITLFLWQRGEANSDRRDIVNLVIAIKEDIYAIREETSKQINAIHLEIKDFHNRLCAIEERRK